LLFLLTYNETHYWIKVDVGNIKGRDPLRAICFAIGAGTAALETKLTGLNKIPTKSKIEQNAYYHYCTISKIVMIIYG
jgi:hypothetical protein